MTHNASTVLLALLVTAAAAGAQDAAQPTPAAVPDAAGVIMAPKPNAFFKEPPPDSDGVNRSVSPAVAAALAEGMPKYDPPTPTPTPADDPTDLRDIDKPKNGIRRLPKFVVQGSRPPIFRQRDLYTEEGLINLSLRAHPGLLIGNILGLNGSVAEQMLRDDERLANMADLADTAHAMRAGGASAEGSYILQESRDTYMRTDDSWMTSGPGAPGDWIK
jgi:hypothetical protein